MLPTPRSALCSALLAAVEALGPLCLAAIAAAIAILGATSDGIDALLPGAAALSSCLSCLR